MSAATLTGGVNLEELEKDEFLQQVQSPTFSVQNHVTSLLTSSSANLSAQISLLTQSLAKIDQAIHSQVTTNHGDLLAQTSNVEVMDSVVLSCRSRAEECLETVEKLRSKVDLFECELADQVQSLESLLNLRSLLRRIQRVTDLENVTNVSAAKQAQIVSEIEFLCSGGSDSVSKMHLDKANGLRRNIKKQTENMLSHALEAKSANQISSSLQIFINLNSLDDIVTKTFKDIEKAVSRDITTALTLKGSSTGTTKGPPGRAASLMQSATNQASQIWSNIESLATKTISNCSKVKVLWLVLQTHRDCDSNILYHKFLDDQNDCWNQFWSNFVSLFGKELSSSSEVIKSVFEADYPKVLNFVNTLVEAIEEKSQTNEITPSLVELGLGQSLRAAIAGFEKAYLSKSLSKLFDRVNHDFGVGFPSEGNIDDVVAIFKQTVDVTTDEQLRKHLCRNVSKTIKLFCVRCEGLVIVDGGATQVIGPPTHSQQTNNKIVNILEYFKIKLKALSSVLPSEDLDSIFTLQRNTIWSLVNGIADAIEAIVLTMHQEQWNRTNRTTEYSLYMGELQAFIARAAKDYLNFQSPDLLQRCTSHLSTRTIELLVRHVSILPNLGSVKGQISIDIGQLEIALSAFTPVLSELGKPYKLLKGFKTLLHASPKEIEESTLIPVVVPASLALNFLFSVSDDALLVAPHIALGWSPSRYSRWYDDKSEAERVSGVRSTLNDYAKNVSSRGQQEYHWTYPIMLAVMKRVAT